VIIAYETDPAAIKRVVPHPLIPNKDNIVLYEWIKMPDSSGFGDYVESGTVIPCILPDGRSVNYTAQMFLDCEPPIACGREIWGFPKKYAHPSVEVNHDTVCCSLSYSGQEVAVGTMAYKHKPIPLHVIQASFSNLFCNLKIIPRANMSGPQIAQLVGYRLQDVEVLEAWEGPARLHLTSSVNAPTGDLPALRVIGGKHIKANLTLPYGEVLYDYVLEAAKKRDAGVSPPVNRDDDELTEEKVLKLPSMPAIRPSYSLIPPHLNNREMFVVIYESDREAILRCLPDTLEADDTNHVVIQFSHTEGTGLGSYSKCSVHIPCRVRRDRVNGVVEGQNMYLYNVMNIMDCSSVITLGREIFGQPNKFGHSKLAVNKDTLVASVNYGHREVVTASMAYKYAPMDKSKAFALLEAPELNLKLIPDADGKKGIAKLMAFHFSDAEVFSAYSGPVRLHFVPHVNAPFADLPVRGVCEGAHLKVDMQMTRSVTVHNYLKDID
jgi:acetoacetate decarboxylase